MEQLELAELAIAAALAWGAGLRAYAVIFAVGVAGAMGWMALPGHLDVLEQPIVLVASGVGVSVAAALLGGTLSAAVHATKAGTRAAINTSPEPFSNWTASLAEDAAVPLGLWLAVVQPWVFLALLVVFLVAAALLGRIVWRGLRKVFSR